MSDKPIDQDNFDDEGWSEADDAAFDSEQGPQQPPLGTSIVLERFPDGVTIQVPPAGLWKGTKGLFVVALIVNGVLAVIACGGLGAVVGGNANQVKQDGAIWVLPLFLSLFGAVGIGLLLGALNMGKRRAALAVTGGSLMVLQTGLFGSKRRQWEPGEVEAVRTGPSGMEVNEVPVLELQIFDGGGKFSLLAGRSDDELEWIAAELRSVLNVGRQLK